MLCSADEDDNDNIDKERMKKKTKIKTNNKRKSMVMARLFNYNIFYLFFVVVGWLAGSLFLHFNKWLHD